MIVSKAQPWTVAAAGRSMIRFAHRLLIAVLSLLAIGTLAVGTARMFTRLRWDYRQSAERCLGLQLHDGHALFFTWQLVGDAQLGNHIEAPWWTWNYITGSRMHALPWWESL